MVILSVAVQQVGAWRYAAGDSDGWDVMRRPVVLCILDGWGYRRESADNAVALAETLCNAQQNPDPLWLATLAAAYAEVERFDDAIATNERAADRAERLQQSSLAKRLRDRSATFANRQPLRD